MIFRKSSSVLLTERKVMKSTSFRIYNFREVAHSIAHSYGPTISSNLRLPLQRSSHGYYHFYDLQVGDDELDSGHQR